MRARKTGQIAIPDEDRKEPGVREDGLSPVRVEDGALRIVPVEARGQAQAKTKGYTDKINGRIDQAISAARRERHDVPEEATRGREVHGVRGGFAR